MRYDIEALDPLHCTMMNIAAGIDIHNTGRWEEVQFQGRSVRWLPASALALLLAAYLQHQS
jgi:hypothetical protein